MAFNHETIGVMPTIHPTTERLYKAAKEMRGIVGQSAVARTLDVSPQVVKNWEARVLSEGGALVAQQRLGCNANWLLSESGGIFAPPWPLETSGIAVNDIVKPLYPPAKWPFTQVSEKRLALLIARLDGPAAAQAIEQLDDTLDAIVSKWELRAETKKIRLAETGSRIYRFP